MEERELTTHEEAMAIHDLDPRVTDVMGVLCGEASLKSPEHVAWELLRLVDSGRLAR